MNENKINSFVLKVLVVFIGATFVFIVGFSIGRVSDSASLGAVDAYRLTGDLKTEYNDVDTTLLWQVWDAIESEYVDDAKIDGEELMYGAVKGLVSGLNDPYTSFLDPSDVEEYLKSNKGEFEGIGATLQQDGELVIIESPLDDSPAQEAGLMSGDIILTVEDEEMQGFSVYEVASKIRGDANTPVEITLYRPSISESYDVTIIRQAIDLDNIVYKGLEDGIAEIKIYKFTEESPEAFNLQWDNVVAEVLDENDDVEGIIIDLRNNPGGYVRSVEYVLAEFLSKGSVLYKEQDKSGHVTEYKAMRKGEFVDIPITVIVNQGSASASEIFAGAIQDHDRGVIIGMSTVGKGVEQKSIKFGESVLQLVFQKWLTPNGTNISSDNPITPDIEVDDYDEQELKAREQFN